MTTRYKDFDEFMSEDANTPLTFKVSGEVYTLPAEFPAVTALKVMRMHTELGADAVIPATELETILLEIMGKEQFTKLITSVGFTTLTQIIMWIFKAYGLEGKETSDESGVSSPKT